MAGDSGHGPATELKSTPPRDASAVLRATFEHNLQVYFHNRFPGGSEVHFGLLRSGSFRTIGKADVRKRTILIHPDLLRLEWRLVLELVMYHEMIHFAVLRHNQEFKRRERRFANFARARRAEKEFFRWLEARQTQGAAMFAYRCPKCATRYKYRSRRGHLYSCGRCSRTYQAELRLVETE